ncbi:MAG: hypothetical protein ACRDTT_16580 [Pseudonocardiaceae bacterium]
MRELAVGAVDLGPLVEQHENLVAFPVEQLVDRVAAGRAVDQTSADAAGALPSRPGLR